MKPIMQMRYSKSGLKKALFAGAALGVFGGAALAQVVEPTAPLTLRTDYVGYSASGSARLGYSDNINLQRDGLEDNELILSTLFTGGAIVSTPRATGIILGDLDFSYLVDQSDFVVNQNIGAVSTLTALDNWLYLDLSGSTTRQLVGDNARFSANLNAGRNQRANVHSYSASPYLYRRFADQSSIEARYRFSQAFVDDSNRAFNPFGGSAFNDTIAHEALATYDSGGLFNLVRFRLSAYGSDVTEDSPDFVFDAGNGPEVFTEFGYQQASAYGDVQVFLNQSFALSGAIGYDEVDAADSASLFFDDDELSGVFWRAGFTASPGRRSNIRLEYGERYGDDFIDANVSYAFSSRLSFQASAGRTFRTRTLSVSSQFRSNARATLDFADQLREGLELSPRGVIETANFFAQGFNSGVAQTSGVAVTDAASAGLFGRFGRTSVNISGNYADQDFGFRAVENYGASLNVRRQVSRRITAYGNVNYRRADTTVDIATCEANPIVFGFDTSDPLFDPVTACANLAANNGVTNTLIGRIGAGYRLYRNASVFAEYSRTERFAPNPLLEYSENAALIGVTLDF